MQPPCSFRGHLPRGWVNGAAAAQLLALGRGCFGAQPQGDVGGPHRHSTPGAPLERQSQSPPFSFCHRTPQKMPPNIISYSTYQQNYPHPQKPHCYLSCCKTIPPCKNTYCSICLPWPGSRFLPWGGACVRDGGCGGVCWRL